MLRMRLVNWTEIAGVNGLLVFGGQETVEESVPAKL